ncbi:hypothetical protein Sviol_54970 [Streptomyces violascens]|uniref:Uncharacterized protein n=1 Tax=Streptomyces violascens TaxID=67381 RepID=A0ABQ3QV50_9ACTN|nr:hypothetical protein Sviol_54970 [Streptomyces violascens]
MLRLHPGAGDDLASYTLCSFYLPDQHLPNSSAPLWGWRTCTTPWPCETAGLYLSPGQCQRGSPTYWEIRGPRHWHTELLQQGRQNGRTHR